MINSSLPIEVPTGLATCLRREALSGLSGECIIARHIIGAFGVFDGQIGGRKAPRRRPGDGGYFSLSLTSFVYLLFRVMVPVV
jgi:hypothetical protein